MDRKHLLTSWIVALLALIGLAPGPGDAQTLVPLPITDSQLGPIALSPVAIAPTPSAGTVWVASGSQLYLIYSDNSYQQFDFEYDANALLAGNDGNMWAASTNYQSIFRITNNDYEVTQYQIGTNIAEMTAGPDGQIWFTDGENRFGALAPDGLLTLFTFETNADLGLHRIVFSADGNLWIVAGNYATLLKISPASGKVLDRIALPSGLSFDAIAVGPDGGIWFAEGGSGAIVRINADDTLTTVATIPGETSFHALVTGSDGNLWAAENERPLLDRISPDGAITFLRDYIPDAFFPAPDPGLGVGTGPIALVPGTGNALWLATSNGVAQLVLSDPSPLAASVLPGGRSFSHPGPTTIFATMANGGDTALTNCQIFGPENSTYQTPLEPLQYQPTDPATNEPNGPVGEPVTIPAHGSQSFIVTFKANGLTAAPLQHLEFYCPGALAPVLPGLNTVDLYAGGSGPDYIMLPASAQPGILHVPVGGSAAFAVAIANLGAAPGANPATVSANTGIMLQPVTITLCLTDPTTGNCTTPPAPTLTLPAETNATMAVFVTANGPIAFSPADNRIYLAVDYADAQKVSISHATTSLALEAD